MNHVQSSLCESAAEEAQIGEPNPGVGTGDGGFEVLGQASAAAEPGEGAFDHPTPRQELEAFDAGWALDDLDRPRPAIGDGLSQLRAAIDAVGKDIGQVREKPAQ